MLQISIMMQPYFSKNNFIRSQNSNEKNKNNVFTNIKQVILLHRKQPRFIDDEFKPFHVLDILIES